MATVRPSGMPESIRARRPDSLALKGAGKVEGGQLRCRSANGDARVAGSSCAEPGAMPGRDVFGA